MERMIRNCRDFSLTYEIAGRTLLISHDVRIVMTSTCVVVVINEAVTGIFFLFVRMRNNDIIMRMEERMYAVEL